MPQLTEFLGTNSTGNGTRPDCFGVKVDDFFGRWVADGVTQEGTEQAPKKPQLAPQKKYAKNQAN